MLKTTPVHSLIRLSTLTQQEKSPNFIINHVEMPINTRMRYVAMHFFFSFFLSFNAHYLNDHWKCIKPLCIFQYAFFVCYFMRLINANFVKNLYGFVLTCVKSVFNMKRLHLWSEFRSSSLSTITLFLVFALLFFRILFPFQSFSPHLSYSLSFSPPHFSYSHSISFANSLLSCSSS